MTIAVVLLLVAQSTPLASPSPPASTCPPTEVQRVKPTNAPDPEWPGHSKWCTGISCFVEEVLVTVNPDGTVKNAVVKKSWGVGADYAAITAARQSTYRPKTVNCQPVEGTYIFREIFVRSD
jgi:TonB family protein